MEVNLYKKTEFLFLRLEIIKHFRQSNSLNCQLESTSTVFGHMLSSIQVLLIFIWVIFFSIACTNSEIYPDSTVNTNDCLTSVEDLDQYSIKPNVRDLPPLVESKRLAILKASLAYDYNALNALIDKKNFKYTLGPPFQSPVAYWRFLETKGEDPIGVLAKILKMDYMKEEEIYIWPYFFGRKLNTLSDADIKALKTICTEEDIGDMMEDGFYSGYRAAIDINGNWILYLGGE